MSLETNNKRALEQQQLADNALGDYFERIRAIPLLSFEEELELSKRIQKGDQNARNKLIEANLRLVTKIAHNYLAEDISFMDIIQEGNMGLIHAAERYDYKKKVRFSTYAVFWIRQSINRFLYNKKRPIRLPYRKEELYRKIQKVYHNLSQTLMRKPKIEEIAEKVGLSTKEVNQILNIANEFVSLETQNNEEIDNTPLDYYEDYTYNPEQQFMRQSSSFATMNALNSLKERERRVLMYRYQLNGNERYSLKKTGDTLGVSPETVRQIEIKALKEIRRQFKNRRDFFSYAM
ncbi:MAG: RNA polymerase sigma factor RpoD/SigA [Spirochaetaceae bacterium]|jgi:RNA polymerase primary sigma factor|nr:RNA polymerase sigma factor RpoD/SigA [Spirochaetaceae bacterium]